MKVGMISKFVIASAIFMQMTGGSYCMAKISKGGRSQSKQRRLEAHSIAWRHMWVGALMKVF